MHKQWVIFERCYFQANFVILSKNICPIFSMITLSQGQALLFLLLIPVDYDISPSDTSGLQYFSF
jgi:hypothetical protein